MTLRRRDRVAVVARRYGKCPAFDSDQARGDRDAYPDRAYFLVLAAHLQRRPRRTAMKTLLAVDSKVIANGETPVTVVR